MKYFLRHIASIAVLINCISLHAQELNFGVPFSPEFSNFLDRKHILSALVRNACTQPLLRSSLTKEGGVTLLLADNFISNHSGKEMQLRLKEGVSFVNSSPVSVVDIRKSFQLCVDSKRQKLSLSSDKDLVYNVYEKEGRIFIDLSSDRGQKFLFDFVSDCPIFEKNSLEVFGQDLGDYNLIVGTGPYAFVAYIINREVVLERSDRASFGALSINIRIFNEAAQALTALRTGTIDAFYTPEKEIVTKASVDTTLQVSSCDGYSLGLESPDAINLISRKDLKIGCNSVYNLDSIKYKAY